MLRRFINGRRFLLLLVPLVALLPLGRLALEWQQMSRIMGPLPPSQDIRGYDWVRWKDDNGLIIADYVFPRGPAAEAGIQAGDIFFEMDYQQYFNAEDLEHAIGGIQPGRLATYSVQRVDKYIETQVRVARYPTFLYPLSSALWQFSLWGFTLGSFLHVLALIIVGPLGSRSRNAMFSLVLIFVSALWIIGNLLRLLMVEFLGPVGLLGTLPSTIFEALTVAGLVGWVGFPTFLLHKMEHDAELMMRHRWLSLVMIYLPLLVLGGSMMAAIVLQNPGPFTQDALIAPILFYASCYVAAAALIAFGLHLTRPDVARRRLAGWNRIGSLVTFFIALLAGLFVLGVLPNRDAIPDLWAGWLIVAAQLLSVAPVILVSTATLKRGKMDVVLRRGLSYLTVLGLLFFVFVAGLSLVDPVLIRLKAPRNAFAGLYVIVLLLIFERVARGMRAYINVFFATDRMRTRQLLSRFNEQLRSIVSLDILAHRAVETVAEAFGSRSVVLSLKVPGEKDAWRETAYHPEPPFVTRALLLRVWPYMEHEGRIWSSSPEINESDLDEAGSRALRDCGVRLAVPILGDRAPLGLLLIGERKHRRSVYNLEDTDLLRSLGSQLALAIERLNLIEREKALIRETAEAQLVALRAQINPHFLFNTLNTIAALIDERPHEAENAVEHLASIFRHVLQVGSEPYVTLEEEINLVGHYLGIEATRFGDNLKVHMEYDPALGTQVIPAFTVQTLVENAVKHGVEKQRGGGRLTLTCKSCRDGYYEVMVEDTGVGIPSLFDVPDGARFEEDFFGIGLRNVSSRLTQLYGRDDLLQIVSRPEKGTTAIVRIPCRSHTHDNPELRSEATELIP